MNNKTKLYWQLQITGWLLHSIILIISSLSGGLLKLYIEVIVVLSVYSLIGFFLTHTFRKFLKKKQWVINTFKRHLITIFVSSTVLSILLCLLTFLFQITLQAFDRGFIEWPPKTLINAYDIQAFISTIANAFIVMLVWTSLYITYKYFENFQNVRIANLETENKLKDAQYAILHSQLNPHFLFNALTSIRALTLIDGEKAWTGITQLSDLLRYTLDFGHKTLVMVEDEMIAVKDYLEIETIRFNDKLNFTMNISAEAASVKLPPVSILTLVENAVKHGIGSSTSKGQLDITCFLESDYLHIEVKNTGQIKHRNTNNENGIGIKNLLERLQILYQKGFHFSLSNINDNQVVAILKIPQQ